MSDKTNKEEQQEEKVISVGDLVRLSDDSELAVGVGLVLEERDDNRDVAEALMEQRPDFFLEEIPEFLLYKPVYLVLWHGEAITPTGTPVWMFKSELELVKKQEKEQYE